MLSTSHAQEQRILRVHEKIAIFHVLRMTMLLAPALATPRLDVSTVTASAAAAVVTLERMTLQSNLAIRPNLVVSILKALCAQTTGVSRCAIVAAIDNGVFLEHIVATLMRGKISLDPRNVLIIAAFFGKNTTEELKRNNSRKQQRQANWRLRQSRILCAIHPETRGRVLPAMKATPDLLHSVAGYRTGPTHQGVVLELT